jgi:hypothetical protein
MNPTLAPAATTDSRTSQSASTSSGDASRTITVTGAG